MNFHEAEAYLLSLGNEVETMKLGLENITILLEALGDPQKNFLKVQVAGTNGKGSVCAFLDSICLEAGILTGLYTSPHLISITERIKIGGKDVSDEEFARLSTLVRITCESLVAEGRLSAVPTYFEQVTAMALRAFVDAKVQLAILETGLGGRFDATTAANAEIAAITRIDLDHQEYLGDTIEKIAEEKAGIIRPGSMAVLGKQRPEALNVLLRRCQEVGVIPTTECEAHVIAHDPTRQSSVVEFRTSRTNYSDSSLGLAGKHQVENACVAVLIAERLREDLGFAIGRQDVCNGLEKASHPGRLELQGRFLLDGAHNPVGAASLADHLAEFERRPITLIFGAMKEKDVHEIAAKLFPLSENIFLTRVDNSRAMTAEQIAAVSTDLVSPDRLFLSKNVSEAIAEAERVAGNDSIILITGSLYLVGEAKRIIGPRI